MLNNAAKFSGPGARVTLSASVVGATLRIEIRDRGIGITADLLPRIFEMFAQGDVSPERRQSGLGVGLALAKRLVELHDGSIAAASPGSGEGSVFTVTLPLVAALTSERVDEPVPQESRRRRHRILLVDDNVDFATSLAILLEKLGHEVRVAHEAKEALATAHEFVPEFAFLDLGLPTISGFDLARELRARPRTAAIVLIALSGWGQARDRERSREAGFALHLVNRSN